MPREVGRQLVEHLGYLVIDVLGAVVGVETQDEKGETSQQRLDDVQEITLLEWPDCAIV